MKAIIYSPDQRDCNQVNQLPHTQVYDDFKVFSGGKKRMIFICISKESSLVILPKQRMFVGKFWDGNCQTLPKERFPTYKQEESSFSTSDHVNMLKASEPGLAPQDNILLNSVFSR